MTQVSLSVKLFKPHWRHSNKMETINIQYCFTTSDGAKKIFDLNINGETLLLEDFHPEPLPSWTRLDFHQCAHCSLDTGSSPYCPVAANLTLLIEQFENLVSYDKLHVEVTTDERTSAQETTAQQAISSLMGLVVATSDCPHTAFLKPMARFHLPLASEEETIFRAASTYLLGQYFLDAEKSPPNFKLDGLTQIYKNIQQVNHKMGDRLRAATKTDSSINALILLDAYAKALPFVIKESLEEIKYLFEPFLAGLKR